MAKLTCEWQGNTVELTMWSCHENRTPSWI
jgi:hypothetical protein